MTLKQQPVNELVWALWNPETERFYTSTYRRGNPHAWTSYSEDAMVWLTEALAANAARILAEQEIRTQPVPLSR